VVLRGIYVMGTCQCGCGEAVKSGRVFANKEHQLKWMTNGGARELNALLPLEARVKGGETAGQDALASGRLLSAAQKGGARSREIAQNVRAKQAGDHKDQATS